MPESFDSPAFCLIIAYLCALQLQLELVGNEGDEFAVCGLASARLHRVAEEGVEGINVASVPRYLDCVAYRTFHAACGGLVFLRNRRVENLGDRIDDIAILDSEQNGGAEILVALFE